MEHNNPLKQYFRSIKMYIQLPSGPNYYEPGVVEFTNNNEVGVYPMTGKDEIILKNPDALLNGEALIEVFLSCVPAVKNPRALLTNDVDALITAIRCATYNDLLETQINCPNCRHENTYSLDLQYALDNISYLDDEYVVNLDSGLSVFLEPYKFPDQLKSLHAEFERNKLARAIESETLSDEARSDIFKKAFRDIARTKYELMCSAVKKIVDESNNVNVTDKKFISEFLQNIDKKSADKISDMVDKINAIGIKRTFKATCEKCKHEWENDIDFNPVNFS